MSSVLIVEDNTRFREKLRDSLASRFPTVIFREAVNGKQAFREIDSSKPVFICMDIGLGDDNGLELTKEIKNLYPEISIMILTNYGYSEYRDAAFHNGADFFLIKGSATIAEIAESLEKVLFSRDKQKSDRS